MGWVVNATPPSIYPRETSGTHCRGGLVGHASIWTGAENLAPTSIRSPDRPARSLSLYRLSYPSSQFQHQNRKYIISTQYLYLTNSSGHVAVNVYSRSAFASCGFSRTASFCSSQFDPVIFFRYLHVVFPPLTTYPFKTFSSLLIMITCVY